MASKFDSLWAACGPDADSAIDRSVAHYAMQYAQQPPTVQFTQQQPGPKHRPDPKSCTQCGVTKTPQWREGPLGPKTLCNACGVKRVRQLKSCGLSGRRRANRASLDSQACTPDLAEDPTYSEESQRVKHNLRQPRKSVPVRSGLRPEDGHHAERVDSIEMPCDTAEQDPMSHRWHSDLDDESPEHSDSAEEVAWVPGREKSSHREKGSQPERVSRLERAEQQETLPQPVPPSPGPVSGIVGTEDAAAVNLMSMSAREEPSSETMALLHEQYHKDLNGLTDTEVANRALRHTLDNFPEFEHTQQLVSRSLEYLTNDKQQQWLSVQAQMEQTLQSSAAAEAAVLAVAKVLAYKQAEAREARKRANETVDIMRPFMLHIWEECETQKLKRARTSVQDY